MKGTHIQRIYWNDVMGGVVYFYGSRIKLKEKTVYFENLTFPSGKPIKTWRSRTNYQGDRTTPELPILIAGVSYRLEPHIEVEPEDAITIQIEYRNRQNEVIKVDVLRDKEKYFTFPAEAFTYTIVLKGSGCDRLTFKFMDLYAVNLPQNIILEPVKVRSYRSDVVPRELALVSTINKQVK